MEMRDDTLNYDKNVNMHILNVGRLHICGSTASVSLPVCLLLDDV